ncbi:hypothetical protein C6568_11580 [Melaminivora suipulveris]|uniref:DUF86 domain-containing protein n=1 Tax=Melaminivora suipulveris TaxID=2109913 RepID=A0A2R3QDG4_9BURK|nr:HepT-like ribonuclease domain-containing protein [Melaminivora suipulveris]AVO49819.1 hypothetical protein C6568_11580 [Melaminivora suipulveris]
MQLDRAKYLYDIQHAGDLLAEFVQGRSWQDYEANAMLRAAVERQFEIIGEAIAQLAKRDTELVERISEYRNVIAFRNVLIHGYAQVDDRLVWDVVQTRLPLLRQQIGELLRAG